MKNGEMIKKMILHKHFIQRFETDPKDTKSTRTTSYEDCLILGNFCDIKTKMEFYTDKDIPHNVFLVFDKKDIIIDASIKKQ